MFMPFFSLYRFVKKAEILMNNYQKIGEVREKRTGQ